MFSGVKLKQHVLALSERFSGQLSFIPDSLRIGAGYRTAVRDIRYADSCDASDLEQQTFGRLRALVMHANLNIPFYRKFYAARGFSPEELKAPSDWLRVPIITKDDLQSAPLEKRCAPGVAGFLSNTGGTSGAPLVFRVEKSAIPLEWAHMHRIWKSRGYRSADLKLRFGGAYFSDDVPIVFHPRHNEFIVNANCSMPRVVEAVLALPARHMVRWVHGYPSLVAEFAHGLAAVGGGISDLFRGRLHGVLLGSEFPASIYRDAISMILSSNIISWYGHSEMAVLAGETASGIYQSLPTYGFAEALASEEGSERLVCTSLHNFVHPFIRYDTGDLIQPVFKFGASLAFRIVEGRVGDFVTDRNGRRLSLTSIIFGRHHSGFDDLLHLQVRQDAPGRITLLIVPRSLPVDVEAARANFDFSGLDLDWRLELLAEPLRTSAGKIRLKVGD